MKSSYLKLSIVFLVLILLAKNSLAQNLTTYPYGGDPDTSRIKSQMMRTPLNFHSLANFHAAEFDSLANFEQAQFDSLVNFARVQFHRRTNFHKARFDGKANFAGRLAGPARFYGEADFTQAQFHGQARFSGTAFLRYARFTRVQFDGLANFSDAKFLDEAYFGGAKFHGHADFSKAEFDSLSSFRSAQFDSLADFREAQFSNKVIFASATFNGRSRLDFRNAELAGRADFSLATLKDTLFVGTPKSGIAQRYDFMRAYLLPAGQDTVSADTSKKAVQYPGARIVLFGPVELNMQTEKIEFLDLSDDLDYYAKKDIVSHLKETALKGKNSVMRALSWTIYLPNLPSIRSSLSVLRNFRGSPRGLGAVALQSNHGAGVPAI